jgi:hypothetical protein
MNFKNSLFMKTSFIGYLARKSIELTQMSEKNYLFDKKKVSINYLIKENETKAILLQNQSHYFETTSIH